MTDYPDVLLSYDHTPDPDMPTVGSIINMKFTVENKQQSAVTCTYIAIDLNQGNGADNLATENALGNATPQLPTDIVANFKRKTFTLPGEQDSRVYFILTPKGNKPFTFDPGDTFSFQINNILVNNTLESGSDTLTMAQCRTIEISALGGSPVEHITAFTVPKYPTGTAFRNFTTAPPDQVVVKRGDALRLQWTANPPPQFPQFEEGKAPPYYRMQIYYDQLDKLLDVTANNGTAGGSFTGKGTELLNLSHTTPFTLYLTLCDKNGQQITHTLTTLAVVSPTDVSLTDLALNETASILTIANPVTQADTATASTDGFLLCSVQGSPSSEPSGLVITLQPPQGQTATYNIASHTPNQPYDDYTFLGPRILLPVAKGTTVSLVNTPTTGTYRAIWYPLGTGPLLGPLPSQPAPTA